MSGESELLKKRFIELSRRGRTYFTFTDFLGLAEQSALSEVAAQFGDVPYTAFGGAVGAERVMVRFGDPGEIGYDLPFPIVCLKAEPKSQKFADRLTHRDFLGALLGLGIERTTLGDIAVLDNVGYIFVKEEMAEFIISALARVKHTDVVLSVTDKLPEGQLYKTEQKRIQLSGERLDAIIAKVYGMSREDALSLFRRRSVYVLGRLCENNSYRPKPRDVISVRGVGRFIWVGYESTSKKGKLNCQVEVYV